LPDLFYSQEFILYTGKNGNSSNNFDSDKEWGKLSA